MKDLNAQAAFVQTDPYQAYYEARQWFSKGNYGISYPVFKETERRMSNGELSERELQYDEVLFYTLACELMQENISAERHAYAYLKGNNSAAHKSQMAYYLGMYYFKKQGYEKAAEAFSMLNEEHLSEDQKTEMSFAYGYSLITLKRLKEAKPYLNMARLDTRNPRYIDANYYYGLIAYNEGQFSEAIQSFEIAGNAPAYQPLTPYYTASIQYALGNKDKGLELAEKALKQGNQYYEAELHQLAGHAYFEKKEYATAIPHLENYIKRTPKVKREDLYELAFSYYQQKNWNKSIEMFKPLSSGSDSLSQHAMYLLGDAYLKVNDKANAKTAFRYCAANSGNPVIRENSLFNDGKLSHDLGLDAEAVQILKYFMATFPKSTLIPEAQELLIAALANTSNYREALVLYENLGNKSASTQRIYPRILYNRAQEEITDRRLAEAEVLLDKALNVPYNEDVFPVVSFWKGELAYFKKDYAGAIKYMNDYLRKPTTVGEATPENARYTLAYSLLQQGQNKSAEREFETLARSKFPTAQQADDIKARLADSYYMQKDFAKAKPLYNDLMERRSDFADYALFQLGMIAGAENKGSQKISFLQSVDKQYPNSVLAPAANLEIAKTYLADDKYRDALPWLGKVINAKGGDTYKPEALLKQGLTFYNLDQDKEALNSFKVLLDKYGDSPEAEEAIDNARSIFVEQGRPNDFVAFMNSVGRNLDRNTADSLSFVAAELQLSDGKKDQALKGFTEYLKQYPEGRYHIPASWYAAELYRDKKDMKNAINLYAMLVEKAPHKYAEGSMIQAARYFYFEVKDYEEAIGYYEDLAEYATSQENRLEAMRGIVRCQYYSGQYDAATKYATDLLEQRGIGTDDKVFANLVLGKQAAIGGNCNEAIRYYKEVDKLSKAEIGAEARYGVAECLFKLNKLEDAENAAFETIKKSGSYVLWVTKSYILLGDIYYKQKDYFNAKATYKSVSENATIESLKKEASEKLAQVEKEEKEQSKISQ
ncbi:MAG: tetratricopeptide repeat protein [Chitinophagaceae bacterium]|nr:tetratricopeptide repeat protein [Chitinophagaceae bacterium]